MTGVPPCHVNHLILGEGKDISQFLAPTMFIHQRGVKLVLTAVSMEPPPLRLGVNFIPNVVSVVENISADIDENILHTYIHTYSTMQDADLE